jgi:hypothetical protein
MRTQSIVLIAISFTTTILSESYCKREAERGANGRMVQKGHSRETKDLFNHTYIPHPPELNTGSKVNCRKTGREEKV